MKKENETARKILEKLYSDCTDFALFELNSMRSRSTENNDYFRAEGAYYAYRYLKEVILEYKSKLD